MSTPMYDPQYPPQFTNIASRYFPQWTSLNFLNGSPKHFFAPMDSPYRTEVANERSY